MAGMHPVVERLVLHWGEMGSLWNVNRSVSQIHALLYFSERPLPADEIADLLGVARSNVSTSLRELQNWNLIKITHLAADRRDHFETTQDPWELLRVLVRERRKREFDPTVAFLRGCVESREFAREDPLAQKRLRETLSMMESLSGWTDEMLALETTALKRLLKLGARLQGLLH